MNKYFSLTDKVYDITEKYPELIEFLAQNGFAPLKNELMRKSMGRTISLETALRSKHYDLAEFEQRMVDAIEQKKANDTAALGKVSQDVGGDITIKGVLPCPIRLQILEKVENWIKNQPLSVNYNLPAASMGLDWLEDEIKNSHDERDLADIYLSAGFSLFFNKDLLGHYSQQHVFANAVHFDKLNAAFDNDEIDLKDPRAQYFIIGAVPAIFSVNKKLLGDRPMPRSWKDLLSPEFADSIAVPMKDLDLFNAVQLGIYAAYGEEGVIKLGRNLMTSMHPAQMVKSMSQHKADTPLISVMPYFFTCMIGENDAVQPVWPEDGAIISPIFFITKKNSAQKIKPLADFLTSQAMGQVLSVNGKFPSSHPDVDNHLTAQQKFLWPGWDFIYAHDIGALLTKCEHLFLHGSEDVDAAGEKA